MQHPLISSRAGQGTSLQIMGLATIDPHSQKPSFTKSPSLVLINPILSEIQSEKKYMAIQSLRPDDQAFLRNFDVFKWLHLSQN